MNVNKLIAKAYPVISSKVNDTDLILTIENPADNNEDFEIVGFTVKGNLASASFNDSPIKDVTKLNEEIKSRQVSLWDGDKTELVLQAAKNSTVQVNGISIRIDGKIVDITSDYTNVGKWTNFKVTVGDKGSAGSWADSATTQQFTVTFMDGTTVLKTQVVDSWDKASAPTAVKSGYKFVAWTPAFDSTAAVIADATYNATWHKLVNVTYNANGHTIASADLPTEADQQEETTSYTPATLAAAKVTCSAWSAAFQGWNTNSGATASLASVTVWTDNIVLYAICN